MRLMELQYFNLASSKSSSVVGTETDNTFSYANILRDRDNEKVTPPTIGNDSVMFLAMSA